MSEVPVGPPDRHLGPDWLGLSACSSALNASVFLLALTGLTVFPEDGNAGDPDFVFLLWPLFP